MSHSRERNEANCLNCDTEVLGRYCHVCGQENIEPRESFWSLITHFFNDITHFDGKFFHTVGHLTTRPGFLAAEYMKGRRARYLHPIRMYLFTSALFFFVFYSYTGRIEVNEMSSDVPVRLDAGIRTNDSAATEVIEPSYASVSAYDSAQNTLPASKRDGFISRVITRKYISIVKRYGDGKGNFNTKTFVGDLLNGLIHTLPSLLFVSLPLFALVLKLLYGRRHFVYADHAIFLVFMYIFMFILVLAYIAVDKLTALVNFPIGGYLLTGVILYGFIYSFISMRRFYGQAFGKTLMKFTVFNMLAATIIFFLFIIFLLLTLLRV